eukprot:gene18529-28359_t
MSNTSLSARAEWVQQIQTPAPPSHIQLGIAATGAVVACPAGDVGEEVAVWPNHGGRVSAASVPLASLKGHSSPVTAIRYGNCSHGHDDQEKMASASDDALLVWTLPGGGCIRVDDPEGSREPGLGGYVGWLAFSQDDTMVCACVSQDVIVADTTTGSITAYLE